MGVKYSSPGLLIELFQGRGLTFLVVKFGPNNFGRGVQNFFFNNELILELLFFELCIGYDLKIVTFMVLMFKKNELTNHPTNL